MNTNNPMNDSILDENKSDLGVMAKSDVSKKLFAEINWQEILRAGVFLSAKDHQFLERSQDNLSVILDNPTDSKALAKLLLKLADNCTSNVPVQQYVFTRVEEIVQACEELNVNCAAWFTADGQILIDGPFIRQLHSPDAYCRQSASTGLALLLSRMQGDMRTFCLWISDQMHSTSSLDIVLHALTILLRSPAARTVFMDTGGVKLISAVLTHLGPNGNAQFLYELTFALWTCTLSSTSGTSAGHDNSDLNKDVDFDYRIFLSSGTIPLLSELIGAAPSRKVVRMCIATLRNLATLGVDDILTEMLNVGIDRQVDTFIANNSHKQANDTDVEADAKQLQDILSRNYRNLSTFEKWHSEIHSGALRWGIVHTEAFWRENARLMEENDFAAVKKIIGYLKSDNRVSVAIALYDLGEFTRFYPNGRSVTKSLGGKDLAMTLIDHENADIQRQALQCISKVMISNWDHMK